MSSIESVYVTVPRSLLFICTLCLNKPKLSIQFKPLASRGGSLHRTSSKHSRDVRPIFAVSTSSNVSLISQWKSLRNDYLDKKCFCFNKIVFNRRKKCVNWTSKIPLWCQRGTQTLTFHRNNGNAAPTLQISSRIPKHITSKCYINIFNVSGWSFPLSDESLSGHPCLSVFTLSMDMSVEKSRKTERQGAYWYGIRCLTSSVWVLFLWKSCAGEVRRC